jgi:uncharacterized protein (DUF779 family)
MIESEAWSITCILYKHHLVHNTGGCIRKSPLCYPITRLDVNLLKQ